MFVTDLGWVAAALIHIVNKLQTSLFLQFYSLAWQTPVLASSILEPTAWSTVSVLWFPRVVGFRVASAVVLIAAEPSSCHCPSS